MRLAAVGSGKCATTGTVCGNPMVSLSASPSTYHLIDVFKFIMSSTLYGESATSLKSFAFSIPLAVTINASLKRACQTQKYAVIPLAA